MQKRFKKLIACLCCLAMMVPLCVIPATAEDAPATEEAAASEEAADSEET